jgi:hypothetical protein
MSILRFDDAMPLSTRGWPTEVGSMQFSALWHHQAPPFRNACPRTEVFSLEDCVASGSVTPGTAQLLARMIEAKLAFLISRWNWPRQDDFPITNIIQARVGRKRAVRPLFQHKA